MTYSNTGLVKHCEKALSLNTKYMWGGLLRPITDEYIAALRSIYGVNGSTGYSAARYKELARYAGKGYFGVDCVGLVKSYYWSGCADGGVGSPGYSGSTDVNAGRMYNLAAEKGKIGTLPEIPGLVVYSKSHPHVGVYVGGGFTIESTLGSRGDGVVKHKLDSFWEYWFKCPFINYSDSGNYSPAGQQKIVPAVTAFSAVVRSSPSSGSAKLGELSPGTRCSVIAGSDARCPVSGYVYVRLADSSGWIVKSALK